MHRKLEEVIANLVALWNIQAFIDECHRGAFDKCRDAALRRRFVSLGTRANMILGKQLVVPCAVWRYLYLIPFDYAQMRRNFHYMRGWHDIQGYTDDCSAHTHSVTWIQLTYLSTNSTSRDMDSQGRPRSTKAATGWCFSVWCPAPVSCGLSAPIN